MKTQATLHHPRQRHLDTSWTAWFDCLTITNVAQGEAVLSGPIADQAALYGVLAKVRDLGLPLLAVSRVELNYDAPAL
jgi:hypothetical protein